MNSFQFGRISGSQPGPGARRKREMDPWSPLATDLRLLGNLLALVLV